MISENNAKELEMIKGVTKSIIEIHPKNECFERIIVILNNSCNVPDKSQIEREAALLVGAAPDFLLRQRRVNRLKIAVAAVTGSFFTATLFTILYMFV